MQKLRPQDRDREHDSEIARLSDVVPVSNLWLHHLDGEIP